MEDGDGCGRSEEFKDDGSGFEVEDWMGFVFSFASYIIHIPWKR